jgi:uridine kinase
MDNGTIRVRINDKQLSAPIGTRIIELLGRAPHPGKLPALGAVANRRLTGLYRKLTADAIIRTIDYNSRPGVDIYRRSTNLLLYAVVKDLYPQADIEIGQSIVHSYYFEVHGLRVTKPLVERLERAMKDAVEKDLPYVVERVFVDQAIRYFESVDRQSKVRALNQTPGSEIAMVSLMNFRDIVHGPVCISTGFLKNFRLTKFRKGLLITFPDRAGRPGKPPSEEENRLLFDSFSETRQWNELVGATNLSDLNEACIHGTVSELIRVSEALHEKKIGQIADQITHRKRLPKLILVAGPSSSGKTTFSQRLSVQLRVNGVTPKTLSMDNYYVDRTKTPLHPDGSYDFEAVEALDLKLFNEQLASIIAGETIQSPVFDFETGKRHRTKTIPIRLGSREVLILEGIHALNDRLHKTVARPDKFKIFVSALTQLAIDEHNRIFTSDTRLIRRMVRDRLYRGYRAADTILGWDSVRAGENKHIFPFQNGADVLFNSALVYEHAVLKPYAKRFLMEISREDDAYTEAVRLYQFLEQFIPIFPEEVPLTSVLREFIGGSVFRY